MLDDLISAIDSDSLRITDHADEEAAADGLVLDDILFSVRSGALKLTALAGAQCSRIRTSLLKIGAIVTWNTRRIQIKMSEYYPYQTVFQKAAHRLL